jgi:hypothetical protein
MVFWKYFEVGAGKKISYSSLNMNCTVQILCPFCSTPKLDKISYQKSMSLSQKVVRFMFCPEDNCTSSFEAASDLSLHIAKDTYIELYIFHC